VLPDLVGPIAAAPDGAPTAIGLESTIIACLDGPPTLLRPGGVTREAAEEALGRPLDQPVQAAGNRPLAPGMLASHYAPRARLRLDAAAPRAGEAWLGFGRGGPMSGRGVANLSPSGDLAEAAANLFGLLRLLDASGAATIAVAPIPREGLGEAIRDRLARAAADR
jgi:L-threonylcarbamoyladenylate synthase